ncbi:MAG: hypothetical protein ABI175_00100 [Polyangiales bacterium]
MQKLSFALILAAGCTGGPDLSTSTMQITLEPQTGIGFVGKGAVQGAFHWNNADLQANAGGLSFSYTVSGVYEQSCIHTTNGGHKVVQVTFQKHVDLAEDVAYAARRNPQNKINGFNLTGITGTTGGAVPTDLCNPGQSEPESLWAPDPQGAYPQVTQTSGTPATLSVTYAGVSHAIWTEGDSETDETDSD